MREPPPVTLLGPQRFQPTVAEALRDLAATGPIAVITAGWQEREAEVEELSQHVGVETVNLRLYARGEQVFARDRQLHAALRRRQDLLQQMQDLYRMRLSHTLAPALELMRKDEPLELLPSARRSAIRAVRTLDNAYLRQVRAVLDGFEGREQPREHRAVQDHRQQIAEQLARCDALVVAGGHVAVLLNRMRLFGVPELLGAKPIIGWSAGAMVLAEKIVLFHDSPPQGPGNAEVLAPGFGLARKVLPLPDASQRLRLEDPRRVALFARRFAPSLCLALDGGAGITIQNGRLAPRRGTVRLARTGRVVAVTAS